MERLFGADGVRGVANHTLTPETVLLLGRALGGNLVAATTARPAVVVGRDPRPSGDMLTAALMAGIASAGADILWVGVVPTAAVAYLVRYHAAAAGVAVTASHNPLPDNGLKFFDAGGWKYSDDAEADLESQVRDGCRRTGRPRGLEVGRERDATGSVEAYLASLLQGIPRLDGLNATVDCANGAAAVLAPEAYRRAGVTVTEIASDATGDLINCGVGATNLTHLRDSRRGDSGRIGLAHDGDADRLLAVDEEDQVVDGSHLLAIFALDRLRHGRLDGKALVTTAMSNSGLAPSMARHGVRVVESPIGDRSVLAMMRRDGYVLGGEQYGHIIMLDRATTGDGILTALELMAVMVRESVSLHSLTKVWSPQAQVIVNVPVGDRTLLDRRPDFAAAVAEERRQLTGSGRLIVRMSTIEPVVRVMCEAGTVDHAQLVASRMARLLEAADSEAAD